MGEIRIVGPGKTRGYPYTVCKKGRSSQTAKWVNIKLRDFSAKIYLQNKHIRFQIFDVKYESMTPEVYFFKIETASDTNCSFHGNQKCPVTVKCPYHYGVVQFQI